MRLELRDGARMHYAGHGEGPPIVLVHSLGYDHSLFDRVTELLGPQWRALSYDLRGHGESSLGSLPPGLDTLAADLRELLNHLGIRRAHFIGQSIGGMILLQAACDGFLDGTLCLLDTIAWTDDEWNHRYVDRAARVRKEGMSAIAGSVAVASLAATTVAEDPLILSDYTDRLAANDSESYAWACEAMLHFDLRPGLANIQMPLLAAAGEQDLVAPLAHASQIARLVPHGSVKAIPASGHLPACENPEFTAALISDWLCQGLEGR